MSNTYLIAVPQRTGEAPVSTWAVAPAANSRFLRPFRRYRGCKGRRNDKGLGEGETFMAVKDEDPEAESEVVDECITLMASAEDYPPKKPRRKKKAVGPYGDIESRGCQKRRGEIGGGAFFGEGGRVGGGVSPPLGGTF